MTRHISSNGIRLPVCLRSCRAAFLAVLLIGFAPPASAATLNMSRDLVARGIAAQNMTPNSPSLDARPLFQAALDYVRNSGGVTTVRAAHLVELRACVDAVRLHYGLPAYPYADLSVGSTPTVIKGQLRSAIRVLDPVLH